MATPAEAPLAGRYRRLRRLGSGGVATVFLAEDERLGRRVAVKRLIAGGTEEMAQRFEREARLGASLNHPNLVIVYDITADAEQVLIVMEYVAGGTLADALREGALDRERVVEVLGDVAAALDHAHARGVVHRDVKPANVLLGLDGRARLADLGIAVAAETTHITHTGTVLGTPSYMAPEQLEGGHPGPAADVYALATVAFEALSGRKARQGRTPLEVAHRVATEPAPDVREAWPDAPAALSDELCAGMATDPADRPASAGELVRRLEAALDERPKVVPAAPVPARDTAEAPPGAAVPGTAPRSRRGPLAALAVVALLAVGAVAAILALGGGEPAAPDAPGGGAEAGSGEEGAAAPAPEEPVPQDAPPTTAAEEPAGEVPASPDEAATSFYERSAAGDYRGAWALATPSFRQQLGGFGAFQQSQSTLEEIEFEQADVVEEGNGTAQVEIGTVATHSDGVDQCEGTLSLASGPSGGWLIDGAAVTCPESTRPQ